MRYVRNTLTQEVIKQPTPIDLEVHYDGKAMITETDKHGIITFANRKFVEMTGYSVGELVGSPHNINRHPHMPKAAFSTLWHTISRQTSWNGIVKNMRKDGKYYWVNVWIIPKYNENDEIIGYIASRKTPHYEDIIKIEETYKELLTQEN